MSRARGREGGRGAGATSLLLFQAVSEGFLLRFAYYVQTASDNTNIQNHIQTTWYKVLLFGSTNRRTSCSTPPPPPHALLEACCNDGTLLIPCHDVHGKLLRGRILLSESHESFVRQEIQGNAFGVDELVGRLKDVADGLERRRTNSAYRLLPRPEGDQARWFDASLWFFSHTPIATRKR